MQDTMNNSASAAPNPEGHQHSVMVLSRKTTRLGHENSAAAVPASDTAQILTVEELARLKSPKQLLDLLQDKAVDVG